MEVGNEAQNEGKLMVNGREHGAVTASSCLLTFIQNVSETLKDSKWGREYGHIYIFLTRLPFPRSPMTSTK